MTKLEEAPRRPPPTTDPSAGFSLIEMLIAMVVLAASIGLLADALRLGWRGLRTSAGETIAVQIAERELTGAGILWPLAAGHRDARDGEHSVVVQTLAIDSPSAAARAPARRLYLVTVDVRWTDGWQPKPRLVTLSTYKLGPPDDGARR